MVGAIYPRGAVRATRPAGASGGARAAPVRDSRTVFRRAASVC